MISSKRILIFAYAFPPLISPQSLRWFYLCRELIKRGYEIDVITVQMPENFQDLVDKIPKGLNVHCVFPGPFYYLTFKYSRESFNEGESKPSTGSPVLWRILSKVHFNVYKALNALLIPDIYSEWLLFAIKRGLKLIRMNRYDIIISSSEPRVCHLAAYFLKKKSGIPWIADYGDPWIYPVPTLRESKLKRRILRKIEAKILKRTDTITVAAEGIKRLYLDRYPFLQPDKVHVITQGFDPDMFSQVEEETSSKFRIVYCGSLYKNLRDPMAFFEAITEIDEKDIEIIIAGRINEFAGVIKKEGIDRKIKYRGFLRHKESLALQKGASVLLHIGNVTDVQVPGKIYEYVGARRPVLCIKGGGGDLSSELIIRSNKGIVVNNYKNEIKEGIIKLYSFWQKGLLDKSFNLNDIEEFTWQRHAEDMSRIIEEI
ncbi:MAG TPA: glycosyltransferase [Euryarchaeota archaeon]|nr:glycosyltransferase [Euryarchaeota archaeon]